MNRLSFLPGNGSTGVRAWLHLVALAVLAGAGELVASGSWRSLPSFFYGALPLLGALALGIVPFRRGSVRLAVGIAGVCTAAMLGLDLVDVSPPEAGVALAAQAGGVGASRALVDVYSADLLSTVLGSVRRGGAPSSGPAPTRSGDLLSLTAVVLKGAHLLLPAALLGILLGVQAWVADHVIFRRPVDARVAHLVLAWVLSPAVFFLVVAWAERVRVGVVLRSDPLATMALPYLPFVVTAGLGWLTALRLGRFVRELEEPSDPE